MAPAMIEAGPVVRSAVMQCVNHPAATPAVQQAAIQVFRLTRVPEEASENSGAGDKITSVVFPQC